MWVKFSEKNPIENIPLITRSPGYKKKGDCFEDWRLWKRDIMSYNPPPSHWWDGDFNMDLALKTWNNEKDKRP